MMACSAVRCWCFPAMEWESVITIIQVSRVKVLHDHNYFLQLNVKSHDFEDLMSE